LENLAYPGLARGPLDEVAANLRRGASLAAKIPAWQNLVYQYALLGKCFVLQGKLDESRAALSDALHALKAEKMNSAFRQIEYLTAVTMLHLALADRLEGSPCRIAVRDARHAARRTVRHARKVQGWLPEALRLQGTAAWLSGNQAAAQECWRESIAVAEKFAFPIERARTLLEIGHRRGNIDLIEQASQIFQQSGAKVFLAFALHSLAQLRSRSSTDITTTVPNCTKAIAALEEAGADYELGVAYRQRAYLYKRLGQLDNAISDLKTAQECFEAVRATSEREEVAQEANAISTS
jgi:tetratricopeptide (TPR) repeat protein